MTDAKALLDVRDAAAAFMALLDSSAPVGVAAIDAAYDALARAATKLREALARAS